MRTRVLLLLALLGTALSGCSSDTPALRTAQDYNEVVTEVQDLTQGIFERYDAGNALTEKDKKDLHKAAKLTQSAIGFQPTNFALYFLAGKIQYTLGNYNRALDYFDEAIAFPPPAGTELSDAYTQTVAESRYLSSQCAFNLKEYETAAYQAELASSLIPGSAVYITAQAAAELQLNKTAKAKNLVRKALKIDPQYKKAQNLARYLGIEDTPEKGG